MTIDHWLMIAMIIATLIAPVLSGLIISRSQLPTPKPEANHPKNLIHKIGGRVKRFLKSAWPMVVSIAIDIYLLINEISKSTPMNRLSVLLIALAMTAIGIQFTLLLLVLFFDHIFKEITDIHRILLRVINLINAMNAEPTELKKLPRQTILHKMLSKIRTLLGG